MARLGRGFVLPQWSTPRLSSSVVVFFQSLVIDSTFTVVSTKLVGKLLPLGAALIVELTKLVGKTLGGITMTMTVALVAIKVILKDLIIAATYTVGLVKQVGKLLPVDVTLTAAFTKFVSKSMALTMTATASLTKQIGKGLAVTGTWLLNLTKVTGIVIQKALEITTTFSLSLLLQQIKGFLPLPSITGHWPVGIDGINKRGKKPKSAMGDDGRYRRIG